MSHEIGFDEAHALVVVNLRGQISSAELKDAIQGIWQLRLKSGALRVLWDCRASSLAALTAEEVRNITTFQAVAKPGLPRAHVALLVGNDLDYGIARMLCGHVGAEHLVCRVFRDADEAGQWLAESID